MAGASWRSGLAGRIRLAGVASVAGVIIAGYPALAAVLPPANPGANLAFGGSVCTQTGGSEPDSSPACVNADLIQIDLARAKEGVGPMYLPTDYSQLSGAEQQFVVINLERTGRGLPPVVGMTSSINALAAAAVKAGTDPEFPTSGLSWGGSIWAAGFPSTLEADFAWMYADGPGSDNIACPTPTSSGCWGHRDIILADPAGPALVAGAATAFTNAATQYAAELQQPAAGQPALVYSWPTAVAAGAGAAPLPPAPSRMAGWPVPIRLAGADRVATAIAISQSTWAGAGTGRHAQSAVIAPADANPDALAAVPLAAAKQGPLLLTGSTGLDPRVSAEIDRVLASGRTVYVVGGVRALSPNVDATLTAAGYQVVRIAGADRFATAVAIAGALGNPTTVLEANGDGFADALAAGPAAAAAKGALLLTDGPDLPSATAAYLAAHHPVAYAIGGPAAHADPAATPIAGPNRYATAAAVAARFFADPKVIGFVSGTDYADAVAAGGQLAETGGPLLLVGTDSVPPPAAAYVAAHLSAAAYVFGGQAAVRQTVVDIL